jgi:hypothetical protein
MSICVLWMSYRSNVQNHINDYPLDRVKARYLGLPVTSINFIKINRRFGRGGAIRTPDPLRPRQVRYQAALRPDICWSLHSKTPPDSPHTATRTKTTQNRPDRAKTASVGPLRVKTPAALIRLPVQRPQEHPFSSEYFLNTLASSCRGFGHSGLRHSRSVK